MKRVTWDFRGFKSKVSCKRVIRLLLRQHTFYQEFRSGLLSDLVSEHHYWYSTHTKAPVKFRKARFDKNLYRNRDGYSFQAYFTELGWRELSWNRCIDGFTFEANISRALRDAAALYSAFYKDWHPVCERCGISASQEVDHVKPEFVEIENAARKLITGQDVQEWEQRLMSDERWDFEIPNDHPAIKYVKEAHKDAVLMAVCKSCHLLNTQERKANQEGTHNDQPTNPN